MDDAERTDFLSDVLTGLSCGQKSIQPRWFYDARGSALFEDITQTPEYYPTRAETALLTAIAPTIAARIPTGGTIIEYGSGSSTKTPLIIDTLHPARYIPIDVSGSALDGATAMLQALFPSLIIQPVLADFTHSLCPDAWADEENIIGFFPGSTIGNFAPDAALDLLSHMAQTQGADSWLVLGVDQCSDTDRLNAAYNDASGITAQFNLNLITRINRELGTDIPSAKFRHRALFNAAQSRIEMHLEAVEDLEFTIGNQHFAMRSGETIHTENSHKLAPAVMEQLVKTAGWSIIQGWSDSETGFAIYLLRAE